LNRDFLLIDRQKQITVLVIYLQLVFDHIALVGGICNIDMLAGGSARQIYDVYLEKEKRFKTQDVTAQKKKSSF